MLFASVGVGTTFPLLNSTTGRLFLAFMPRAAIKPHLDAELAQAKPLGPAQTPSDIEQMIREIRDQGYVEAEGHLAPGIWAASAPVFDSQDQLVACLTIVGAVDDATASRKASIRALLAATTDASERLGARTRPHQA